MKKQKWTFWEKERGWDREPDQVSAGGELAQYIEEHWDELEGMGIASNVGMLLWRGGPEGIDVDTYLNSDLGNTSALERILLAIRARPERRRLSLSFDHASRRAAPWPSLRLSSITRFTTALAARAALSGRALIDAHPDVDLPKSRSHKKKRSRTYRLEQAIKFLTGRRPKRGEAKFDNEEILTRIAEKYLLCYYDQNGKFDRKYPNLQSIILSEIDPHGRIATLDPEARENEIRPYREDFKAHKHRLLVKVSSRDFPDPVWRDDKIDKVIALLASLGIAKAP